MRRKLGIFAVVAILFSLPPPLAQAETVPDIFITEVQTSSDSSGSQEFIELYNNTDVDIDLADTVNDGHTAFYLQYFSSTKVMQTDFDWQTTAPSGEIALSGIIPAGDYYLLSTSINSQTYQPGGVAPDQTYTSSHLSDAAGGLQLVSQTDQVATAYDQVGWSSAAQPPNGLYATPPAGGSLQRPVDEQGGYLDEQGELNQFVPSTTASPKEPWQMPPPEDDPATDPAPHRTIDDSSSAVASPDTLELTELLPNPASPATDSNDEFVEIYNYGGEPVDLSGFTIQAGLNFSYSFTIDGGTLQPHAYAAFTSSDTPLALANSGGQARLLSPVGRVIDETSPYVKALEGQAWALIGDTWQWTATPTPAAANILKTPITPVKGTRKTSGRALSARYGGGLFGSAQAKGSDPSITEQALALHPAVLAGVGGAALLYGAYEYRHDLANRLYQLRRYRAARRAARAAAKGA